VLMQVMSGKFARPFIDMPEVAGSGGTKSQRGQEAMDSEPLEIRGHL
jgi:hypothetical protein